MTTRIESVVHTPDYAGDELRQALGLAPKSALRVSYLPGPGDLQTTYRHWKNREFDPRVPSVAYSTMFFEVCARLSAKGQIITRSDKTRAPVEDGDFTFHTTPYMVGEGGLSYHMGRRKYAMACLAAIKSFNPHLVVVASDLEPWHLATLKRSGARIVYSMHNTFWPMGTSQLNLKTQALNALSRLWLSPIDAAICTSHECERQLQQLSPGPLTSFVETPQQIEPITHAESMHKTGPATELLYLGRIEESKGVLDLLDAFEELSSTRPTLKLKYLGDGGYLETLRNEIKARGLEKTVETLGHVGSAEVHHALTESHILVCPTRTSFNEGLAFVCFEAALHATPTVMSSVVPARDLLKDGCLVFNANSTADMTSALKSLVDDNNAWEALSVKAAQCANVVFDRDQSWGTHLYRAFIAAATKN